MKDPISSVPKESRQLDFQYIASAVAYIRRHYQDAISDKDISKAAGTCERHLRRLFQRHFALTPSKLLRDYRLSKARGMLLETNPNQSVKEIAYDCGYSDPLHFSKTFKSLYGVSPDTIRKRYEEKIGQQVSERFDDEVLRSKTRRMKRVLTDRRIQIIHREELHIKGGGFVENNSLLPLRFEWIRPCGFLDMGAAGVFMERQFYAEESPKYPCVLVCF